MKPAAMGDRRGELRTKRKDNRKVALPQDLVTELQREGNTACTISDTRTFFKLKRDPSVVCPGLKYCCTKRWPRKMISVSQISAEYAQIFEITDIAATIRLGRTGVIYSTCWVTSFPSRGDHFSTLARGFLFRLLA